MPESNFMIRNFMFIFGCLLLRYFLTFMAQNKALLPYMGLAYLIIGISMAVIFVTGARETGREVMGDKIWWNFARPVHATLYIAFALMAFDGNPNAWKVLLVDTTLGAMLFTGHRLLMV
jgi:hypothetical protein